MATGVAEDMQLSVDKALHDAKLELADKMYPKLMQTSNVSLQTVVVLVQVIQCKKQLRFSKRY